MPDIVLPPCYWVLTDPWEMQVAVSIASGSVVIVDYNTTALGDVWTLYETNNVEVSVMDAVFACTNPGITCCPNGGCA